MGGNGGQAPSFASLCESCTAVPPHLTLGQKSEDRSTLEIDEMEAWRMPVICATIAGVLVFAASGILEVVRSDSARFSAKYLANKTDEIRVEDLHEHFMRHYPLERPEVEARIRQAVADHPSGVLFHFNLPDAAWKAHGGEKGYAIARGRFVLWRLILARS